MFRCKECGSEYQEKPDYCNCGNDTFEEIIEKPIETPKTQEVPPPAIKQQPVNIQTPQREEYSTSFNNRDEVSRTNNKADILSLSLFVLSIGLAICTIFVFGNPKEQPEQQDKQTQNVQAEKTINIPNVDSYWDNSTAGIKPDNIVSEENIIVAQNPLPEQQNTQPAEQPKATSTPMSKFEEWLNKPKRVVDDTPKYTAQTQQPTQVKQTTPAKQTTTTQPKQQQTTQTAKTQTTQTKPVTSTNPKINSPGVPNDLLNRIQNNIQFTNTNTPKTATTATTTKTTNSVAQNTTSKPVQTTTTKPVQATTTPKTTVTTQPSTTTQTTTQTAPALRNATHQQVKSSAELQQEVASYKASLRNAIGKKINFANVIGDGNCALTFKVDSSGKLINRNFATQSSNITLNDAVYKAMMSTPSYNPPPEGYKSETMTLRVKIYDGNYEITLN